VGITGAAAFFAARRLAGFFAFFAGFRAAFFATFRFAALRFAGLRPAFFAALRAGFFAAALRTVVFFFAAFLRPGFFFAVIGIETTPFKVRGQRDMHPPQNTRKYAEVRLTKQYFAPKRQNPCQAQNRETLYFIVF
jgi:hypothetical protein